MNDRVREQIGKNLRQARKQRFPRDTQQTFGVRIGVSRETVRKMEQGDGSVSFESYLMAADILDCLDSFKGLFEMPENLMGGNDW